MTSIQAATILDGWAAKAKTRETRDVCELAAKALRAVDETIANDAATKLRAITKTSGSAHVGLEVITEANMEVWVTWIYGGPTCSAPAPAEALDALAERTKKAAP